MSVVLRLISGNSSTINSPPKTGHGQSPKTGNGSDHKATILLVEDETLIRLSSSDFLREAGYRVLEASDVAEAQVIIGSSEPIELVFSDINMPGQFDGIDLAVWLQQKYPDVIIVLTSGVAHNAQRVGSLENVPFISKPYAADALLRLFAQRLKLSAHGQGGADC